MKHVQIWKYLPTGELVYWYNVAGTTPETVDGTNPVDWELLGQGFLREEGGESTEIVHAHQVKLKTKHYKTAVFGNYTVTITDDRYGFRLDKYGDVVVVERKCDNVMKDFAESGSLRDEY